MFLNDPDREVLPRWRSFEATLRNRELGPLGNRTPTPRPRRDEFEVDLRLAEWREHQSPSFAADLLAAAVVLGDEDLIKEAAAAVQGFGERVSPLGRAVAERAAQSEPTRSGEEFDEGADDVRTRIASMRGRLRRDQRNAIAWAELARFYAITGNRRGSKRAMLAAAGLAPNSRYILRSGTRLSVHLDEPDWGQALLRGSPRTAIDPWLTAADISVAALTGRSSRLIKAGRRMLDSAHFSNFDTAELAAALGTREMQTSRKQARRLFDQALIDPTENAVAQVVWASRRMDSFEVDPGLMKLPDSFEARARTLASSGERAAAVDESWRWMHDEPFAVQAPAFGSYQASVGEEYEQGVEISLAGLVANSEDFTLLNNATFCLANAGRIDEAERLFGRVKYSEVEEDWRAVYFATRGLLDYRSGRVTEGRANYTRAMKMTKDYSVRAVAAIVFAREEVLARTDRVEELTSQAYRLEELAEREGGAMGSELRTWLRQLEAVLVRPEAMARRPTSEERRRT